MSYGSNRKWMVMVTCAGTGWPFRVAGSYWYCFKDSTAAGRNEGGPERTLMKLTSPAVPTTASITTLPVSKSRSASKEATARTDLINFGGTTTLSAALGATESAAVLATWRSTERFPATAEDEDVFLTTGSASELLNAKGCVDGSAESCGSAGTATDLAAFRDGIPADVTGASLATFVLLKSEWPLETSRLPGGDEVFAFAPFAGRPTDVFFAADCHGLKHAAPTTVNTSAAVSSARRKTPPRKLGVKLPLARNDLLRFGKDILKSSEGWGSCPCSSCVHCGGSGMRPAGRGLSSEAPLVAASNPSFTFDVALGALLAGTVEACRAAAGTDAKSGASGGD